MGKQIRPEPYKPCPCWSGEKYKFCCYQSGREVSNTREPALSPPLSNEPLKAEASNEKATPYPHIALSSPSGRRRCGLCGKIGKLTKTECCGNWICDDEDKYVVFSYATNSCHRNHRRYTLCGFHHTEDHRGPWQDCKECREDLETEMYVHYGTNESTSRS